MIFSGDTRPTAPPRRSRYIDVAGVVFEYDGTQWKTLMYETFKAAVYTTETHLPQMRVMENDLPTLQKFVGGYLESAPLAGGLLMLCNEDGLRLQLPSAWAVTLAGQDPRPIMGNFFVCRRDGDEMADLHDGDAEALAKLVRPIVGGVVA